MVWTTKMPRDRRAADRAPFRDSRSSRKTPVTCRPPYLPDFIWNHPWGPTGWLPPVAPGLTPEVVLRGHKKSTVTGFAASPPESSLEVVQVIVLGRLRFGQAAVSSRPGPSLLGSFVRGGFAVLLDASGFDPCRGGHPTTLERAATWLGTTGSQSLRDAPARFSLLAGLEGTTACSSKQAGGTNRHGNERQSGTSMRVDAMSSFLLFVGDGFTPNRIDLGEAGIGDGFLSMLMSMNDGRHRLWRPLEILSPEGLHAQTLARLVGVILEEIHQQTLRRRDVGADTWPRFLDAGGFEWSASGTDATEFVFRVRFVDANSDLPDLLSVVIGRMPHDLKVFSTERCQRGRNYERMLKLPVVSARRGAGEDCLEAGCADDFGWLPPAQNSLLGAIVLTAHTPDRRATERGRTGAAFVASHILRDLPVVCFLAANLASYLVQRRGA